MQMKIKQNCSSHTNQSKKSLSPAQLKAKIKNNQEPHLKSIKIQKEMAVVPIKRRQHQPSKSSIQTSEQKHYNSPNSGIVSPSEQRPINQFTFTQLLKKNSKNQPICSSDTPLLQLQQNQPIVASEYARNGDSNMRKSPLTGRGLTKTSASLYYESNPIHIEMDLQDQIADEEQRIEVEYRKQRDLSNNKSVSRSPIRLANAHKINNTPKIKQKGKKNIEGKLSKKQSKTFTSVLNTQSIEKSRHCKKESINLLCSEKIYKFIEDNQQEKDSKTDISLKHKSNLLSTGIINLSQPLERTEQSNNHLYENAEVKRIISGRQEVKEFEDEEMVNKVENSDVLKRNISDLKEKVEDIKKYLTNKVDLYDDSAFCQKIGQSFNPQLNFNDISQVIVMLTQISYNLQQSCQEIISNIQDYSTKISLEIKEQIKILQDSKYCLIDWTAVQSQLEEKHQLQQHLSKAQIFSLRLDNLSTWVDDTDCQRQIQNSHLKELKAINTQIQKQIFDLNLAATHSSIQSDYKKNIGQKTVYYFREKEKKIEALFSSIEDILNF